MQAADRCVGIRRAYGATSRFERIFRRTMEAGQASGSAGIQAKRVPKTETENVDGRPERKRFVTDLLRFS